MWSIGSEVLWLEAEDLWLELEGLCGESESMWSWLKVTCMVRKSSDVGRIRGVVLRRPVIWWLLWLGLLRIEGSGACS